MIVYAPRAAAILHGLLRERIDPRPFLLPANICAIVPETFRSVGQPYELVDISEPWFEMDAADCLARARTGEIAGVLFARTYGLERDPSAFFRALREAAPDLLLIDDKCLCRPDLEGASITALADATLFSTGYAKHTDLGGGGFAHLASGVTCKDVVPIPSGYARRVTEGTATAVSQKAAINAIYQATIPAEVQLPMELQQWRFNLRVPDSVGLVDAIFAAGLFASRHYAAPAEYPVAARLAAEVVNLFNDRYFDVERARRVSDIVVRHLAAARRAHRHQLPREE